MTLVSRATNLCAVAALLFLVGFFVTQAQTTNPPGIVPLAGTGSAHSLYANVQVDTNGVVVYPSVLGGHFSGLVSGVRQVINTTTNTVLTQAETGAIIDNNNASAGVTNTLPSATVPGTQFTLYTMANYKFALHAGAFDAISLDGALTGAGGGVYGSSGGLGGSLSIVCELTNLWVVTATRGTNWNLGL